MTSHDSSPAQLRQTEQVGALECIMSSNESVTDICGYAQCKQHPRGEPPRSPRAKCSRDRLLERVASFDVADASCDHGGRDRRHAWERVGSVDVGDQSEMALVCGNLLDSTKSKLERMSHSKTLDIEGFQEDVDENVVSPTSAPNVVSVTRCVSLFERRSLPKYNLRASNDYLQAPPSSPATNLKVCNTRGIAARSQIPVTLGTPGRPSIQRSDSVSLDNRPRGSGSHGSQLHHHGNHAHAQMTSSAKCLQSSSQSQTGSLNNMCEDIFVHSMETTSRITNSSTAASEKRRCKSAGADSNLQAPECNVEMKRSKSSKIATVVKPQQKSKIRAITKVSSKINSSSLDNIHNFSFDHLSKRVGNFKARGGCFADSDHSVSSPTLVASADENLLRCMSLYGITKTSCFYTIENDAGAIETRPKSSTSANSKQNRTKKQTPTPSTVKTPKSKSASHADDIQLRRCVLLYERPRKPHYCSSDKSPTVSSRSNAGSRPRSTSQTDAKKTSPRSPRPNSTSTMTSSRTSRSCSSSSLSLPSAAGSLDLDRMSDSLSSTANHAQNGSLATVRATTPTKLTNHTQTRQENASDNMGETANALTPQTLSRSSSAPSRREWDLNGRLIKSPTGSGSRTQSTSDLLESGHNASDISDPFSSEELENGLDASSTDTLNETPIAIDEDGYPQPKPSTKPKQQIFNHKLFIHIDENAVKAGKSLQNSFDDLLSYLLQDAISDLVKVRAIFKWMTSQTLPLNVPKGYTDTSTPRGFLFAIREHRASYSGLFATLCRRAAVPCVIIHGIAKTITYEVGDKVSNKNAKCSWNTVYIDGEWRLVHPYWASHSVTGHHTGRWAVVRGVEEARNDGNQLNGRDTGSAHSINTSHVNNEFYFLTDPEKFITKCFPESAEWQLLPKQLTKTEFDELPFLQPAFYELKLKDLRHDTCIVHTENGKAEFEIQMCVSAERAKKYTFRFKLHARRDVDAEGEYDGMSLARYCLQYKHEDKVFMQIRFPFTGIFKLEVHCTDSRRHFASGWACDYKIICNERNPNCQTLPVVPEHGWGPGDVLEAYGLEPLTHKHSLVNLDGEPSTFLRFVLPKGRVLDIEAELLMNNKTQEDMKSHVTVEQKDGHLTVRVEPPGEGEYALQMYVKGEDGTRTNICNYLMQRTQPVEDPELADIREQLQNALESGDADMISHWMAKFNGRGMSESDLGDLHQAKSALLQAKLNRDIEEAIARKDLDLLERTLHSPSCTSTRRQLGDIFDQAEKMRSRLRRHKRLQTEVLAMDQKAISEIRSYPKPPPAVHAVMIATFLLLGNDENDLQEWPKVKALISKRGKESLKRRVAAFDTQALSAKVLERVHAILSKYDLETVQVASVGAATFRQWAFTMSGGDEGVEDSSTSS